jgi:hypothetical protein
MSSDVKKIKYPSGQQDLYKSVKFLKDFEGDGIKKGDVEVIVHASTNPANIFYVEVHGNNNPMPFPKTGLELIKPKT